MKLYFKPGACSLASHIVLLETGAAFSLIKTDTEAGRTEAGQDFSTISPNGYVPALETGSGAVITENPALLQYLADQFPEAGLAPANGTLERVRLQEILNFLSAELHKAFGPFFSGTTLTGDQRKAAAAQVHRRSGHIEQLLSDGRAFLTGAAFTVADAYAFVVLNWAGFAGISLDAFPLTQEYLDRIRTRPSVQAAMRREGLIPQEVPA